MESKQVMKISDDLFDNHFSCSKEWGFLGFEFQPNHLFDLNIASEEWFLAFLQRYINQTLLKSSVLHLIQMNDYFVKNILICFKLNLSLNSIMFCI